MSKRQTAANCTVRGVSVEYQTCMLHFCSSLVSQHAISNKSLTYHKLRPTQPSTIGGMRTTITTTVLWPFAWKYSGKLVTKGTFTHSHLSWSSTIFYQLPPSTTNRRIQTDNHANTSPIKHTWRIMVRILLDCRLSAIFCQHKICLLHEHVSSKY